MQQQAAQPTCRGAVKGRTEGETGRNEHETGTNQADCVSWALADNGQVLSRAPACEKGCLPVLYLYTPRTPRSTTLAVAQGRSSQIPGQKGRCAQDQDLDGLPDLLLCFSRLTSTRRQE